MQVELHDFVALVVAGVGHLECRVKPCHGEVAVLKRGVTQAVTEGVEWLG